MITLVEPSVKLEKTPTTTNLYLQKLDLNAANRRGK